MGIQEIRQQQLKRFCQPVTEAKPKLSTVTGFEQGLIEVETPDGRQLRQQQGGRALAVGDQLPIHDDAAVFTGRARRFEAEPEPFIAVQDTRPAWWALYLLQTDQPGEEATDLDGVTWRWLVVTWERGYRLREVRVDVDQPAPGTCRAKNFILIGEDEEPYTPEPCFSGERIINATARLTNISTQNVATSIAYRDSHADVVSGTVNLDPGGGSNVRRQLGTVDLIVQRYIEYQLASRNARQSSFSSIEGGRRFDTRVVVEESGITSVETEPTRSGNTEFLLNWRTIKPAPFPDDNDATISLPDLGPNFTAQLGQDVYEFSVFEAGAIAIDKVLALNNGNVQVIDDQFTMEGAEAFLTERIGLNTDNATRNSTSLRGVEHQGDSGDLFLIDLIHAKPSTFFE